MFRRILNIYYIIKIYGSKEYFKILPIESKSPYFDYFLDFYNLKNKKNLKKYNLDINNFDVNFYILRNLVPSGIFLASKYDENTLKIELDFVIPEYRDFKIGNFIFEDCKNYFLNKGYYKFITSSSDDIHIKYLKKMGFEEIIENDNKYFVKSIK